MRLGSKVAVGRSHRVRAVSDDRCSPPASTRSTSPDQSLNAIQPGVRCSPQKETLP